MKRARRPRARHQTKTVTDQPTKIGKYQIRSLLGSGGMATVYEAYDPVGDRVLAVKVLKAEFANTPEVVASFVQEAKKAIRLENHDSVLTVYEVDQDGDTPFIAMRRVEGMTLQEEMRKRGVMPVDRVRGIVAGVGGALEHAHQRGIVHCDVKPSNIMIDRVGRSYLMDFGISRAVGDMLGARLDELSAFTPQYASPEQTKGESATVRSDIYSFGVVLYEMVTGTTPYGHCQTKAELRHAVVNEPTCPPRDVNPNVPESLQQVILRALSKEPNARFETMAQFMEAVLDATDEGRDTAAFDVTMLPQRLTDPGTVPAPTKKASTKPRPATKPAAAAEARAPSAKRSGIGAVALLVVTAIVAAGGVFGWDWWQKQRAGSGDSSRRDVAKSEMVVGGATAQLTSGEAKLVEASKAADGQIDAGKPIPTSGETKLAAAATEKVTEKVTEKTDDKSVDKAIVGKPETTTSGESKATETVIPPTGTGTEGTAQATAAQTNAKTKAEGDAQNVVEGKTKAEAGIRASTTTLPSDWQIEVVDATPGPLSTLPRRIRDTKTGIELILVEPNTFAMGSPKTDREARIEETPQHAVTNTHPYYLGVTEVTVAQWRRYVAEGGAAGEGLVDPRKRGRLKTEAAWGDDHPVVYISQGEAAAFCSKYGFRLPTEAQWELACRAATITSWWFGSTPLDAEGKENVFGDASKEASKMPADGPLPANPWPIEDGFLQTAPVGHFAANPWGFFDMAGNVREWCADPYLRAAYVDRQDGVDDPFPTGSSDSAVARGGSWCASSLDARSSRRHAARGRAVDIGFRVARTVR